MENPARKIFQPSILTAEIIEGVCSKDDVSISSFINNAIVSYYTPINKELKREAEFLFGRILNREEVSNEELKTILAICVRALKDYPISDVSPLEQIFTHFIPRCGKKLRYDYIRIVDSYQNEILHHLNDILKTLDDSFILGMREFGERTPTIFTHWEELHRYSEVYIALATIIECENIYYPLSVFRVIELIRLLDNCIRSSYLKPIKTPYEVHISPKQRYYGIRYEIAIYYSEKGYSVLSGDKNPKKLPPEIMTFYEHYLDNTTPLRNPTEDDIANITALEQEGRMLFSRLAIKNDRRIHKNENI